MAKHYRRRPARRDNDTDPAVAVELELTPTTVAHGGVFVARDEGRVVFVADALPGERVLARVADTRHDRFWRADTIEVLEPSPHRVPHLWEAASLSRPPEARAGGAEFGHIELAHQRELKAEVVRDSLKRMAGVELAVEVEGVDGDDGTRGGGWRTRVRLHVDDEGRLGPFASRSHRVVPVTELPLATPAAAAAAPLGLRHPDARWVDIVAPSVGEAFAVVDDGRAVEEPDIRERVGDRDFELGGRGFWQVHRGAPLVLTRAVQEAIDAELFDEGAGNLDLYGGVGLLAAAVGDRFGSGVRITSVESAADATRHAARNLGDWPLAEAVTAPVERFLAGRTAVDPGATVVLDPPRSGAGKDVVERLVATAPAQLVYVACDPVAFARDAAYLRAAGYEIASIRAFDLFPSTHHVELVARFARDEG
jgi:tRNA/tmRNA/rRNA uracil-C5-methylase (TrmA/RlmC/RlmD family)